MRDGARGGVWPLLTGERAHRELAAGNDISQLIKTYEEYASCGQLLPEQVWDEDDRPERSLKKGQPAGSAVPLVWAHAEYLKLLRSAVDGKVFDRIDPVYDRYCEPEGRKKCKRGVEIYSRMRPIERMDAGSTLRILDEGLFEVVWSDDGWKTENRTASRGLGSAGFSADVRPAAGSAELEWTMHWTESDTWLGYNVKVKVEAPST